MKFRIIQLMFLMLALRGVAACGTLVGNPEDDDDNKSSVNTGGVDTAQNALSFRITDAPVDEITSFFVTIDGIEVHQAGGDWVEIPLTLAQEIDVLSLQDGVSLQFAAISFLESGTFDQTKLLLAEGVSGRVVLNDGTSLDVPVAPGFSNSVVLATSFDVVDGQPTEVVLDFDLRKSLVKMDDQNYALKPTLRLVKKGQFGHIDGVEDAGKVVCVYAESDQPDITDNCENSISSAKIKNGKYKLSHLPKGKYKIQTYNGDGKAKAEGISVAEVNAADDDKSESDKGQNNDKSQENSGSQGNGNSQKQDSSEDAKSESFTQQDASEKEKSGSDKPSKPSKNKYGH